MEPVGDHPIPSGPLAPRWCAYELDDTRAGTTTAARIALENAGSATWRSDGREGVQLSYHWLDSLGNPIVWDGIRTALPHPVGPGDRIELAAPVLCPRPPGRYRLAFDLVEEHRFWFAAIGAHSLELDIDVAPRIAERRLAVSIAGDPGERTRAALAAQEEPLVDDDAEATAYLVPGAVPAPDWSRRLLDAHAEGWAAVGPAVVPEERSERRRLAPWKPAGLNPRFGDPLLLPSLLPGLTAGEHDGLPAWTGRDGLFVGLAVVRLPPRSGRRPT